MSRWESVRGGQGVTPGRGAGSHGGAEAADLGAVKGDMTRPVQLRPTEVDERAVDAVVDGAGRFVTVERGRQSRTTPGCVNGLHAKGDGGEGCDGVRVDAPLEKLVSRMWSSAALSTSEHDAAKKGVGSVKKAK
ncbi:hypothetical protein EJB05_47756, partial [Eragrostis curvula]